MFIIDNKEFGWDEIVLAQIWGEWDPFVEITGQSLACLRLAMKNGQWPPASEVREAATALRYAWDLSRDLQRHSPL